MKGSSSKGSSSSAALGSAGLVALLAILLPVNGTARWLATAAGPSPVDLVVGVWLLKGALLATAAALAVGHLTGRMARVGEAHVPAQPTRIHEPRSTTVLLALLLLATAARVNALDMELWLDEIDTLVRYATMEMRHLVSTYDSQNQHPLYVLLAKLSYLIFSGADWSVRVPAVVFGVASLWSAYAFARRVTSRAEALLAVFILALSYHHVWFSQNARGYTALLFFAPIATWLFLRLAATEKPVEGRLVWAYAAVIALASYTHLTAVFLAVGHAIAFTVAGTWRARPGGRDALGRTGAALGLSALLTTSVYALVLPQLLREVLRPTLDGAAVEWTSPWWLVTETVRVLSSGVPGGLLTAGIATVVLIAGMASYWRQSRLLVLSMFVPVAVTAAALIAMNHNLWPRFFFFAASFFVLAALRGGFVIARAVFGTSGERVAVVGAAALASLSAVMLPRAWQPKQQYMAAARFVEDERAPGDSVTAFGVAAGVYEARGVPGDWRLAPSLDELTAMERSSRRLWVIYTFPVHLRATHPELARHFATPPYREVRAFSATVGGGEVRVLLHEVRPAP